MFNQDEGKIKCAVGNREMGLWLGKKAENVSDVGICGIYLSLALGTAKPNNLINHVLTCFHLREQYNVFPNSAIFPTYAICLPFILPTFTYFCFITYL